MQKLQESISKVKPVSGLDVREFRFAVFGPVGGGKSSYINTVMSSFADRITQRAAMGVHDENYSTTNTVIFSINFNFIAYVCPNWLNSF